MKKLLTNLAFWVVLAIVAGVCVGFFMPEIGIQSKIGIDWFIKILKWMVGPIIFLTIISGIVGLEDLRDVGSIGLKGFVYFELVSTLALAVGIGAALFLAPGHGMHLDITHLDASSVEQFTQNTRDVGSISAILKSAIPSTPLIPYLENTSIFGLIANFFIALSVVFSK